MFVVCRANGVLDKSEPADTARVTCASASNPVWEFGASIKTHRIGTSCLAITYERNAPLVCPQKPHRGGSRSEPDQVCGDLSEHSRTASDDAEAQPRDSVQQIRAKPPNSKDPNRVGFVPAFILGDIHVCKLPVRDSNLLQAKANAPEASSSDRAFAPHSSAALVALKLAIGGHGPATGLVGLFASRAAAQQVAGQAWAQAYEAATPQLPVNKPAQSRNPVVRAIQWASDTAVHKSQRVWKALQRGRHSGNDDEGDDDTDLMSGLLKVEAAMSQADRMLGRICHVAEKRMMQRLSVLPIPLTMGLNMVMNQPDHVRLVDLPGKGRSKGQSPKAGKGKKGSGRKDTQVEDQFVPGIATYTIPGITFEMPSTVGPLQFSPLFTSRRTAELTWDIVRETLVRKYLHSRQSKRALERNATEMSAARLTGLSSRVEMPEANEDDEGLSEPSEVAEFLNELGEGDNRPSKSNARFRPRGPLDFAGALACGAVSLFAKAVEWNGNTADNLLLHSPLGNRAIGMAGAPAIQEEPLHTAISRVRDCNVALMEAAGQMEILALQEEGVIPPNAKTISLDGDKLVVRVSVDLPTTTHDPHAPQPPGAPEGSAAVISDSPQHPNDSSDAESAPNAGQRQNTNTPAEHGAAFSAEGQDSQAAADAHSREADRTSSPDQQGGKETGHTEQEASNSQRFTSRNSDPVSPSRQHSRHSQADESPLEPTADKPQSDAQSADSSQAHSVSQPEPCVQSGAKDQTADKSHTHSQQADASGHQTHGQQQHSQYEQPQQQQQANALQMPMFLPPVDDIKCVLGGGEAANMGDVLQGMMVGLAIKLLANQANKVQFPFEVPIICPGSTSGEGLSSESLSDTAKASINFDMSVATGKKKTPKQEGISDAMSPAQALVVVGDVGLDKYRSATQYIEEQKQKGLRVGLGSVGFGNLSPLAAIIEQQAEEK